MKCPRCGGNLIASIRPINVHVETCDKCNTEFQNAYALGYNHALAASEAREAKLLEALQVVADSTVMIDADLTSGEMKLQYRQICTHAANALKDAE